MRCIPSPPVINKDILFCSLKVMEISDEKAVKYYEEVLRLMNEMVGLLKDNNMIQKQHNKTIEELNDRVRKIGINTSNIR